MYYVLYGMRILGIFPTKEGASQFLEWARDMGTFRHTEVLAVEYIAGKTIESLADIA